MLIVMIYLHLSLYLSMYLSIYLQPFLGLGRFFLFLDVYTVGRTPWTGGQPFARPLPAHKRAQTQNKRTQTSMPQAEFEPKIPALERAKRVRALDHATTVIRLSWSIPFLTEIQAQGLSARGGGGFWRLHARMCAPTVQQSFQISLLASSRNTASIVLRACTRIV
jgi:hypothetical protein